jgi:peptide chain release factor 1
MYNNYVFGTQGYHCESTDHIRVTEMLEKLAHIEKRYEELNKLLGDPAIATDYAKAAKYAQERAELEEIVDSYRHYKHLQQELEATRGMLEEDLSQEMVGLIQEEIESLEQEYQELEEELRILLLPKDPKDEKNVIIEIRAGTGGEEAALFAADLYRMYTRYAENQGWTTEILSSNRTGIGGFKEVIFMIKGKGAYSHFKYESGAHRVQRVPVTESGGRIHTSAATVAVLPEMDEVELKVDPDDLRIDLFRATGHGGQSVNTTDSAVRITHLPTGIVATCQDERSQLQNKLRAMSILRARLYDMEERRQWAEMDAERRSQVGTGERSEKIRTYNFPQNRVTDHRMGLTSYRLEEILDGDLDEFIYELASAERATKLQGAG